MTPDYIIDFLPTLKGFEGCETAMYLDTIGNVTCGVGFELPTILTTQAFPWYIPGLKTLATAQEVVAEWNRVKAMALGRLPSFYAIPTALQLRQSDIDAHLLAELDILVDTLDKGISGFYGMRQEWKMALLDLAYNLGASGLLKGYPQLLAAVEHGNGHLAAQQCHREGISAARNAWCAVQFSGQTTETA